MGKGVKELTKLLDDADRGAKAKKILERVVAYGNDQVAWSEDYAKEGYYTAGLIHLNGIKSRFKDSEIATQAADKIKALKSDKSVKVQMQGEAMVAKAGELIKKARYKDAKRLLAQVAQGKKYADTPIAERAQRKLNGLD